MYVKQKAHFSCCPYCLPLVHQTMPVQKLHHELLEKIKNQDGVQDGWHKQENSIPELPYTQCFGFKMLILCSY